MRPTQTPGVRRAISRGSRARRKLAIVGLARRLLILLWGMLKSNQPFRAPKVKPPQATIKTMTTMATTMTTKAMMATA